MKSIIGKMYKRINNENARRGLFFVGLCVVGIILGVLMLPLTVVPADLSLIKILLTSPPIIILNVFPVLCTLLICYFISNTVWVSTLITALFWGVIAEINRFKLFYRDDPFVFEDVFLAREAKEMAGRYSLFLDKATMIILICVIVLVIFCFFFLKRKLKRKVTRLLGTVLTTVLLCGGCSLLYFETGDLYNSLWNSEFGNMWKSANQYMSRGYIYSFIHSIPDAISLPPEGYNKKDVETLLSRYEDVDLPEDKKVNIIGIMLEAYCDLSVYDSIDFCEDPYYNFHRLQEESYHGDLYTNIFAAGTVLTERSFLTGYSDSDLNTSNTQSYVRYFNEWE